MTMTPLGKAITEAMPEGLTYFMSENSLSLGVVEIVIEVANAALTDNHKTLVRDAVNRTRPAVYKVSVRFVENAPLIEAETRRTLS